MKSFSGGRPVRSFICIRRRRSRGRFSVRIVDAQGTKASTPARTTTSVPPVCNTQYELHAARPKHKGHQDWSLVAYTLAPYANLATGPSHHHQLGNRALGIGGTY